MAELNDRFYKTLEFGTGGLRGARWKSRHSCRARRCGAQLRKLSRGDRALQRDPSFLRWNQRDEFLQHQSCHERPGRLSARVEREATYQQETKIVIAHDTRFFFQKFTELTAKVASENGCDANVFDGPRSTPELSFAVRHLNASAGIVSRRVIIRRTTTATKFISAMARK